MASPKKDPEGKKKADSQAAKVSDKRAARFFADDDEFEIVTDPEAQPLTRKPLPPKA